MAPRPGMKMLDLASGTGDLAIAELLVKPFQSNDGVAAEKIKSIFAERGVFRALPHTREALELAAHIRAVND